MKRPVICLCVVTLLLVLTACSAPNDEENRKDSRRTDIGNIRQTLVEVLGEDYWPNTMITAEYLEEYGLRSDIYDDFYGEVPKITTNVDTLIIIGAKEDKVEAAEEVLNKYREALVADTDQYPMNAAKILASRIETIGNYVCFVQLGADTTEEYGEDGDEDAVIRRCQEHNELAIEAIGKKLGG